MSFDSLLRHTLSIERQVAVMALGEPVLDEDGHTMTTPEVVATVKGLVQLKTALELPLASEAGAILSDHTIFMRPFALLESDVIIESGRRFEVQHPDDAGGQGHHLEVNAKLTTSDLYEEGS